MINARSSIASYLKAVRREHGLTQAALAKRAGVSQSLISQVESGTRDLTREAITRLVDKLGLDPGRLAGSSPVLESRRDNAEGWIAYERAIVEHVGLCRTVDHLAAALRPHHSYLASRVSDADGRLALDEVTGPGFEAAKRYRLPPRDEMRHRVRAEIARLSSTDELESLIGKLEALSRSDQELVGRLVERLAAQRQAGSDRSGTVGVET